MGLAHELWMVKPRCRQMASLFDISVEEALIIFAGINNYGGIWRVLFKNEVTPEMVADQIDNHLVSA